VSCDILPLDSIFPNLLNNLLFAKNFIGNSAFIL